MTYKEVQQLRYDIFRDHGIFLTTQQTREYAVLHSDAAKTAYIRLQQMGQKEQTHGSTPHPTQLVPRYEQKLRWAIYRKHGIVIYGTDPVLLYDKLQTDEQREDYISMIRCISENGWLTECEDAYAAR